METIKPEIIIVVEGGAVTSVVSAGPGIVFRVIDIDLIKNGDEDEPPYIDYVSEADNVNVEEYTKTILQEVK